MGVCVPSTGLWGKNNEKGRKVHDNIHHDGEYSAEAIKQISGERTTKGGPDSPAVAGGKFVAA